MKREEKILLYASNLWYLGEGMLGPLFAVFAERVGGNVLDISWAWATYLIFTGLGVIVVGRVSDLKWRREYFLIAGYALNSVFTFAYLLVNHPWELFIVQGGLGVALALTTSTWMALYSTYEDKKRRGQTWGLASGEAYLMMGIALVIGGLIVTFASFDVLFVAMGIIHALATVYLLGILHKRPWWKRLF